MLEGVGLMKEGRTVTEDVPMTVTYDEVMYDVI